MSPEFDHMNQNGFRMVSDPRRVLVFLCLGSASDIDQLESILERLLATHQ